MNNNAKQGRRGNKSNYGTNLQLESPPEFVDDNPPQVRGGWAEDTKKTKGSKSPQTNDSAQVENDEISETEDDIPILPDVDDMQEDLLTLQEMKPQNTKINKATYKELDSGLISEESALMISKLSDEDNDRLAFMELEVLKKYDNFDTLDNKEEWTAESLLKEFIQDDDNSEISKC